MRPGSSVTFPSSMIRAFGGATTLLPTAVMRPPSTTMVALLVTAPDFGSMRRAARMTVVAGCRAAPCCATALDVSAMRAAAAMMDRRAIMAFDAEVASSLRFLLRRFLGQRSHVRASALDPAAKCARVLSDGGGKVHVLLHSAAWRGLERFGADARDCLGAI